MRSAIAAGAGTLLADIAEALDTTVENLRDPAWPETMRQRRTDLIAGQLAADPQFARIARAYLSLTDPAGRRAVADSTVAIAHAFAPWDEAVAPHLPSIPTDPEPS